ncbi:MAG: hypothetical protein E4H32_04220 [Nitrospirales bacterium]|nr:MAG: hypothetical protein E4H32_04220 [Nitrospirales bacterium]
MKRISFLFVLLSILLIPTLASANLEAVRACLSSWPDHPFDANNPSYRSVSGKFKIFGIGEDINESTPTEKPELVLIHPNVSVMTGSTMTLMNPNGWYCLISKVNVMASSTINLHCKAHLASSKEGTTVLGGGDDKGVTVMGKATINIQGCE